jgi:pimeloyl-ACP methyl ester carboxylesterase
MKRYLVCIPGAFHGGWCFQKLADVLHASNKFQVLTPTLAGHEPATYYKFGYGYTMDNYIKTICDQIESIKQQDPQAEVWLLGHSMGGKWASAVVANLPQNYISRLIYLCAFMVPEGDKYPFDPKGDLMKASKFNYLMGIMSVAQDRAKDVFYGNCSDLDAKHALSMLCSEPLGPMVTDILTNDKEALKRFYEMDNKYYIKTLQDRAIDPKTQQAMIDRGVIKVKQVIEMDTDHSPFLSRTEELAEILYSL